MHPDSRHRDAAEVQDNGYLVSLCSGNVLPVAFGLSTFIGLKGPVIAENGGLVSYREHIFQLHHDETAVKAFAYLKTKMPEIERLFTDNWRKTEVAIKRSFDLDGLEESQGLECEIEATGFAIHLMEPGHSKVDGVRKACENLGYDLSQVVAIGDSDNDVKMLSQCWAMASVASCYTKGSHIGATPRPSRTCWTSWPRKTSASLRRNSGDL